MEYNGDDLLSLSKDKQVLLKFYATWCGPCRALAPIIDEVEAQNPDILVVSIDIDKFRNVAVSYAVRGVPTLIALKNGEICDRLSGVAKKETVLKLFD